MAVKLILSTDTLETGFRAKANETFKEIITSGTVTPDGRLVLSKFGATSEIYIDLTTNFFTKEQVIAALESGSSIPIATEATPGKAAIATLDEAIDGVDTPKIITPFVLAELLALNYYRRDEADNKFAIRGIGGKIDISVIPDILLGDPNYEGVYDAATNTPALPLASDSVGKYYIIGVPGTVNGVAYDLNDKIISNGAEWQRVTAGNTNFQITYIDTVTPQNTTGKDGDFFWNKTEGALYQKTGGAWGKQFAIPDFTPEPQQGNEILFGAVNPNTANLTANEGDVYIDQTAGEFFKRENSVWVSKYKPLNLENKSLVSPSITHSFTCYQNNGSTPYLIDSDNISTAKSITVDRGAKVAVNAYFSYPTPTASQASPVSISGSFGTANPGPATNSATFTNGGILVSSDSTFNVVLSKPKSGLTANLSTGQVTQASGNDTTQDSISVAFRIKLFWGTTSKNGTTQPILDSDILALSSEFRTNRQKSFSNLGGGGTRIIIAIPTEFGTASFKVNGLANTAFTKVRSNSAFINAAGFSLPVDVYVSDNIYNSPINAFEIL